jgi:hypothetical protein
MDSGNISGPRGGEISSENHWDLRQTDIRWPLSLGPLATEELPNEDWGHKRQIEDLPAPTLSNLVACPSHARLQRAPA